MFPFQDIKNGRFYLGDCLEVMKSIPDGCIDMILCDLPYGTTACKWDSILSFDKLWEQYKRIIKDNGAIILFGQEPFSSNLRLSNLDWYKYDVYWQKERATNIMQMKRRHGKTVETISIFCKDQFTYNAQRTVHEGPKRTNKIKNGKLGTLVDNGDKIPTEYKDDGTRYPTQVLSFKRDILTSNLHPTQKPVALCENLILTFSNEGELVLDNCAGSGTTAIACENTNRKWICIEQLQEYADKAVARIQSHEVLIVNNTEVKL